jgi:hypothetical protein
MPQSHLLHVVSHWHKLIENVHTSATDFYEAVEKALLQRKLSARLM